MYIDIPTKHYFAQKHFLHANASASKGDKKRNLCDATAIP